jgi:hypothetical protein
MNLSIISKVLKSFLLLWVLGAAPLSRASCENAASLSLFSSSEPYSLSQFKSLLKKEGKHTDTYTQYNGVIESLLRKYAPQANADQFTAIALYLVNWKTLYKGGRGGMTSESIVEAFEIIRQASLQVALGADQADLIRDAMASRPHSLWEQVLTLGNFGWDHGDRRKVVELVRKPFGRAMLIPVAPKYAGSVQGFKNAFNDDLKTADTKTVVIADLRKLFKEFAPKLWAEEFTQLALYLINWKIVFYNPYLGMDGVHTVQAYEAIREASLQFFLTPAQIFQIKSAMETRPGNFKEFLASRGQSLSGWDSESQLTELLKQPFGRN